MSEPVREPVHLGPGSQVPDWLDELDRLCFQKPWGVLEEDEEIIALPPHGFARWLLIPAAEEAELLRIAVAPGARRAGHGEALLRHSETLLRRLGIRTLYLEVRISNSPARALYEQEGWRYQGLRKGYYRDGEDAALYRRDLQPICQEHP